MAMTVDEYVSTKVRPEQHEMVHAIRDFMRKYAPDAEEYVAYGIPVWKAKKIFAVISPNKKGITFSFSHGAEFEDKYKLLRGAGKVSKHILIKTTQDVIKYEAALRDYLQQALTIDAK